MAWLVFLVYLGLGSRYASYVKTALGMMQVFLLIGCSSVILQIVWPQLPCKAYRRTNCSESVRSRRILAMSEGATRSGGSGVKVNLDLQSAQSKGLYSKRNCMPCPEGKPGLT